MVDHKYKQIEQQYVLGQIE